MSKRNFRGQSTPRRPDAHYPNLEEFDRGRREFLLAALGAGGLVALAGCTERVVGQQDPDSGQVHEAGAARQPDAAPDFEPPSPGGAPAPDARIDPDGAHVFGDYTGPDARIDQHPGGPSGVPPAPDSRPTPIPGEPPLPDSGRN
jgi:hypothetical protein